MEEDVTEVVGPKGRHDPEWQTVRHGHEAGEVTLGGRSGSSAPGYAPPTAPARSALPCTATSPTATRSRPSRSSGCSPGSRAGTTGALGSRLVRRIIGYQQLATLALAIERDLAPPRTTKEVATLVNA